MGRGIDDFDGAYDQRPRLPPETWREAVERRASKYSEEGLVALREGTRLFPRLDARMRQRELHVLLVVLEPGFGFLYK